MNNSPTQVLDKAIKAVPAVRYALGVVGIAAAVTIILGFLKDIKIAFLGITTMIALMVVLVVFTHIVRDLPGKRWLAALLSWTIILLFVALVVLIFTSFVFGFPQKLATIFRRHEEPNAKQVRVHDTQGSDGKLIAQTEELPQEEISKIQINSESYGHNKIEWEIYNQTEWRLTELSIKVTISNTPIKDRIYYLTLAPNSSGEPFKTSTFIGELGVKFEYEVSGNLGSIESVKGFKNNPKISANRNLIRPGSIISLKQYSRVKGRDRAYLLYRQG